MKAALIAAVVAAIVASGATTAATTDLITGAQIKNGSIGLVDLSASAKRALRGQRGQRGQSGPVGPPGPPGMQGIAGGFDPAKLTLVQGGDYSVPPDQDVTADVFCPPSNPTPIFAGVGSYTGQVSSLIIFPSLGLARIRVSNFAYSFTITFTPYIVCSAR
jgi:hypothetical protein